MQKWNDFWDEEWQQFFIEESESRDTIDVKRKYLEMAGDLVAGVLLSQIVYWFLPSKEWKSKLRVYHDGHLWLARTREDWHKEDGIPITPRQVDRALEVLRNAGLIITKVRRFSGAPTTHIRLSKKFIDEWNKIREEQRQKLSNSPIR